MTGSGIAEIDMNSALGREEFLAMAWRLPASSELTRPMLVLR